MITASMAVALPASCFHSGCAQAGGGGILGVMRNPALLQLRFQAPRAFGIASLGQEPGLVCRNTWHSGDAGKLLSRGELGSRGSQQWHWEGVPGRSRAPRTDSGLICLCGPCRGCSIRAQLAALWNAVNTAASSVAAGHSRLGTVCNRGQSQRRLPLLLPPRSLC